LENASRPRATTTPLPSIWGAANRGGAAFKSALCRSGMSGYPYDGGYGYRGDDDDEEDDCSRAPEEPWPSPEKAEDDARLKPDEYAILQQLRTKKKRVEYLLRRYPDTRNNDTYLEWLYMRKFHRLPLPFLTMRQLASINLEGVRRARQKLQEEGRYLPTNPEVMRRRRKLREAYRKAIHSL